MPKPTATDDVADHTISRAAQIVDGIITAAKFVSGIIINAASKLITTTYTVDESDMSGSGVGIRIQPTAGNTTSSLGILPKGTQNYSAIDLYGGSDHANASFLEISMDDGSQSSFITSTKIGTGVSRELAIRVGDLGSLKAWAFQSDGDFVLPSAGIIKMNRSNIESDATVGTKIGTATTDKLGFWNATPIVKPTVTGSRGGNAALASLLTALANAGLVTDSTTA